MRSFFARSLLPSSFALAALCVSSQALPAAPKDAQAEKALSQAMGTDYLETKFDNAEKKLRTALETCGEKNCSPAIVVKLHLALGTVLAGGKKQLEDAREAFVAALSIDKTAKPDPDLLSSEISFAFEQALKELKLSAPSGSPPPAPTTGSAGLRHTPPAEQQVRVPVPLFIELDPEVSAKAKKISVNYLPQGESEWRLLVMKNVSKDGYGTNVPCEDTEKEGAVKYYVSVTDEKGAMLASAGSRTEPLSVAVKAQISGEPPHWPGFAPPDICAKVDEGPKQCLDNNQCNEGFVCLKGECVAGEGKTSAAPESKGFANWVTLSVQPDISLFSGEGVCSVDGQETQHYTCLRSDGSRYIGTPTVNVANNVNTGFVFTTLRLALNYERVFLDNFSAGLRVGFALVGGKHANVSLFPVSIEGRASFWIGEKPFESIGVRPFVMASFGVAQFNSRVNVQVLEDGNACGANPADINDPCTKPSSSDNIIEQRLQNLDAYKQAGLGFAALGGGVSYAVIDRLAFHAALRVGVTLPVVTMAISPEAGFTAGF